MTIPTFFILNKKDRTGKVQTRPFQVVLDTMKKQETEEAKIKQSSSLKGGGAQNPLPPAPPPMAPAPQPKENGYVQPPPPQYHQQPPPPPPPPAAPATMPAPQYESNMIRNDPIEIPVPVKTVRSEEIPSYSMQNSVIKTRNYDEQAMRPPEMMSEQYDSAKSYNRQLQRSRACQLL